MASCASKFKWFFHIPNRVALPASPKPANSFRQCSATGCGQITWCIIPRYLDPKSSERSSTPPPLVAQAPRHRPLETERCPLLEMNLGLANCLATNSNVRGLQKMLADSPLLLASKSGQCATLLDIPETLPRCRDRDPGGLLKKCDGSSSWIPTVAPITR